MLSYPEKPNKAYIDSLKLWESPYAKKILYVVTVILKLSGRNFHHVLHHHPILDFKFSGPIIQILSSNNIYQNEECENFPKRCIEYVSIHPVHHNFGD